MEEENNMDWYETMIANSLVSAGEGSRIKAAIEKARRGEPVTLAYLGGSITEGALSTTYERCYAMLFYTWFKEKFASKPETVSIVNAGMSGTPSDLGLIRYDRDITAHAPTPPDLVFIEFAVNDNDDVTKSAAYEGLVRKVLAQENQPAVILVFSVFKGMWNVEDRYVPIGRAYQLPMVSLKQALTPALASGSITNEKYFANDGWHPLDYGHQIMADCLTNLFNTIDSSLNSATTKAPTDSLFPQTPVYSTNYETLIPIDTETTQISINAGGFNLHDTETGTFNIGSGSQKATNPTNSIGQKLPYNFKHGKDSGTEPLTVELTCKNFLLTYKVQGSWMPKDTAGKAEIYLDGQLVKTVDSYSQGGWNNPITILLLNEDEARPHRIEVKMAEGDEGKNFTILTMGASL
jgi:lysophospholipase L1-like esterase